MYALQSIGTNATMSVSTPNFGLIVPDPFHISSSKALLPSLPSNSYKARSRLRCLMLSRPPRLCNDLGHLIDLGLSPSKCAEPLLGQFSGALVLTISEQFDNTTFVRCQTARQYALVVDHVSVHVKEGSQARPEMGIVWHEHTPQLPLQFLSRTLSAVLHGRVDWRFWLSGCEV